MRFMSTLCAVVLMTPVAGLSQTSQPGEIRVDTGSRVRIAAPVFGPKKQVGTVVSLTRDTLVLRQGASTASRSVATSDITALEVSRGTHTRKAKGALWGLLIGAGAGAAIGYATYTAPNCTNQGFGCLILIGPDSKGTNAAIAGAFGGVVGALVGTLVGMQRTEAWVPGTMPAR
ncbi:MAG TPA: hypothetical protein VHE82_11310 [Gemmatimonadaceae bacterium]|nr:hypothetical protein [Gemmatimonadaceae bacterium]